MSKEQQSSTQDLDNNQHQEAAQTSSPSSPSVQLAAQLGNDFWQQLLPDPPVCEQEDSGFCLGEWRIGMLPGVADGSLAKATELLDEQGRYLLMELSNWKEELLRLFVADE